MINICDIELLHTTVVVAIDVTMSEWREFVNEYRDNITDDDEETFLKDFEDKKNCNGSTIRLDNNDYLIFVRNGNNHGDIAHEIFHACNFILTARDFTHDEIAEPWAYLIGYVTDFVYSLLKVSDMVNK